jgi:NitT/TauT family transport system substrate-binding protein
MRLMSMVAAVVMAAGLAVSSAQAEQTIRIGVLQFGTVNWELDTIQRHGLDEKHGFSLDIVLLASNQATTVALQAGDVDMIVSDWLWASRQRATGADFTFVPFSSAVGAIMVPEDSDIETIADIRGKKIAVAGSAIDKGWLLLRGLSSQEYGFDLEAENEVVYGAPPLLSQMALQGDVDAILNYWHFSARLEAAGFRRIIDSNDGAIALGAKGPISAVGYVFNEGWATENTEAVLGFFRASREAKEILRSSDEEWEVLREMTNAENDATLEALRDRFREGIPARPLSEELEDTAAIYEILAEIGGERLVGPATSMTPGTFWAVMVDGS